MSFGWSAGDIVAALQLLHKVAIDLKDSGGASSEYQDVSSFLDILSVTLQHLKALQSAPLDPELAKNLQQLCEHVQGPISSFCEHIRSSFERDLGADSTRLKFLTTGRKLQWALSASKKVQTLREKIGGPMVGIGIVLGQQVVQNFLQMPSEIQARIACTIDTTVDNRINLLTLAVHKEVAALSAAQITSSKFIEGMIRDVGKNTEVEILKQFKALSISNKGLAEDIIKIKDHSRMTLETVQNHTIKSHTASVTIQEIISDMSTRQSQSTDMVLRRVLETGRQTANSIEKQNSVLRDETLSLHQKLNRVTWLIGTVKDHMGDLSIAQHSVRLSVSNSEIRAAIGNIQRSVWLLVSALYILIRELIYLLTPYLVVIYRTSIQPLLLCGDHFLFEDAIGRRKWLPCLQFQHWNNFYHLLIDTFQGEVGLTRVLNGQFILLNGFNEMPITKRAWRAGIQPKSRVAMAIMLESAAVRRGKCANLSCSGQVEFRTEQVTRVCPICGKHLSILRDSPIGSENYGVETTFSFDFRTDIHIPNLKDAVRPEPQPNVVLSASSTPSRPGTPINIVDKDIAAYKRVIWKESEKSHNGDHFQYGDLEQLRGSERKQSARRLRTVPAICPKPNHSRVVRYGLKFVAPTPKPWKPEEQIKFEEILFTHPINPNDGTAHRLENLTKRTESGAYSTPSSPDDSSDDSSDNPSDDSSDDPSDDSSGDSSDESSDDLSVFDRPTFRTPHYAWLPDDMMVCIRHAK